MHFCLFLSLVAVGSAVDVTCPKDPVDINTPVGKFPRDGIATFPSSYSCGIQFLIPDGFIVKYSIQSNSAQDQRDQLAVIDSTGMVNVQDATGASVFYAPANHSWVTISTRTANAQFFFQWQFVDVSVYGKVQNPTGTTLPLNLNPLTYYQFVSPVGPVTFHTSDMNNNDYDAKLASIYVYDGESLANGRYMGNLWQFTNAYSMQKTSGKSLVLVNYYAYTTSSFGIANDYEAVSKYTSYRLKMLNNGIPFTGHADKSTGTAAVTFLCRDCDETYLTGLSIVDRGVDNQLVQFQPATPSDAYPVLLNYGAKDHYDAYLPQQMLTNLFTMTVTNCEASLSLTTGSLPTWQTPYSGRTGFIFAPSVWNIKSSPKYNTNFTSNDMYTFEFDLDYVEITQAGQKIHIEVGSPGSAPQVVEFSETTKRPGGRVVNGTYFSTSSSANSFAMKFEMKLAGSPAPTVTLPVVTSPKPTPQGRIQSTTSGSTTPLQLLSVLLVIAKLSMGC